MTLHTPSLVSAPASTSAHSLSNKAEALSLRHRLLFLMFVGDTFAAYGGLCLAYWLRFVSPLSGIGVGAGGGSSRDFMAYQPVIALGVLFLMFGFIQQKIYDWKLLLRPRKLLPVTFKAIAFWFIIYLCTSLVLKFEPQISRVFMFYGWGMVTLTVGLWKWGFTRIIQSTGRTEQLAQRVVFVGWTPDSAELADAIQADGNHPYRINGWLRTQPSTAEGPRAFRMLGSLKELERVIEQTRPDILVVADLDLNGAALARIAKVCEIHYVNLKMLPSMFQIFVSGLCLDTISGHPLLGVEEMPIQRLTSQFLKRAFDIVGALAGLVLTAPAMLVLAFLIKREDPSGPVFYRQTRSGLRGQPFTIFKLRSMRTDAEANGAQWAQKDDPRRLRIGKFMRESNLDEVPQFWNVLKGDMSLVGPRPERPELIETFEREIQYYNHRHHVKPGITGWAQIHGLRGDTDLSERIRYDCYYIENWSVWMDIYCLLMTFVKRENAY